MVFLGGTPAALIGVATISSAGCAGETSCYDFLINLVTYSWFPLLGGILPSLRCEDAPAWTASDGFFYLLVFGVFVVALAINFSIIASTTCARRRHAVPRPGARRSLIPVLPSELAAAAGGRRRLPVRPGRPRGDRSLFAVVLFTFQYLLGQLLVSEERAEELRACAPGSSPASRSGC